MIESTPSQLRQLKLTGMASALQTQPDQPGTYEGLAFAERPQLLVDYEDQERNQRKQDRLTRAAQFKLKAHAKDLDCQPGRGLQQSQMASLLMCDWLKKSPEPVVDRPLRHRQNLYRLRTRPSSLSERLQRPLLPASSPDPRLDTGQGRRQLQ
jgi:hypothetical protein